MDFIPEQHTEWTVSTGFALAWQQFTREASEATTIKEYWEAEKRFKQARQALKEN